MAERAECVMLNKGPHVAHGIDLLSDVLTRMESHQHKKTPQLRALRVWREYLPAGGTASNRQPRSSAAAIARSAPSKVLRTDTRS